MKNTVRQNASAPTPHSAAVRQAIMMVSAKMRTNPRTLDLSTHRTPPHKNREPRQVFYH